jgi:DNA repair exonuclease SbcCD ATPase subunit
MLMEDRKKEALDNVVKDKTFSFEGEKDLIDFYNETVLSPIERSYNSLRKKLEERDAVLSELSYDIKTYEDIDKMISNTEKLYSALDKIQKEFLSSKAGGRVTGDLMESASEMGLI